MAMMADKTKIANSKVTPAWEADLLICFLTKRLVTCNLSLVTLIGWYITHLQMADPAEPWFTPAGCLSCQPNKHKATDVRSMLRVHLLSMTTTKEFRLIAIDEDARNLAVAALTESEWLRDVLDMGPVDPIPLPMKYQAVQRTLFA